MLKKLLLLLALSIPLFGQTNYYLSSDTLGTGDGLSWTNAMAWGDFNTAIVGANDTVFFDGGADSLLYTSSTFAHATIAFEILSDGTTGNPAVFTRGKDAGHNGKPVFNVPDKYEFYFYGANNVEISYLKVYAGGAGEAERYGIIVSGEVVAGQTGCRDIDILHNEINYTYGSGLSFTYSNVNIKYNNIYTNTFSSSDSVDRVPYDDHNDAIKSNYGFNTDISYNTIINRLSFKDYETAQHRDIFQLDHMNYALGVNGWIHIYNNFIMTSLQEPDSASIQGIYVSQSLGRFLIYNNIMAFFNNRADPININQTDHEDYVGEVMSVRMYNNTIIEDTYANNHNGQMISFGSTTPCPDSITFKNNIVISPQTTGSIVAFYGTWPSYYDFNYNQYEIGLATGFGSSSIGNWTAWTTTYSQDANSEKSSSLVNLVNPITETPADYGLDSLSSGVDEGTSLATVFTNDFNDSTRSGTWDNGAIEYFDPIPIPPVVLDITGAGTIGNPYILYNPRDVDSIRFLGVSKVYELGADIDFTEITGVGADTLFGGSTKFRTLGTNNGVVGDTVVFDGKGYTINGMDIYTGHHVGAGEWRTGMFGVVGVYLKRTIIKNIYFTNCTNTFDGAYGSYTSGSSSILAGYFDLRAITDSIKNITFTNCTVSRNTSVTVHPISILGTASANSQPTIYRVGMDNCDVSCTGSGGEVGQVASFFLYATNTATIMRECYIKNSSTLFSTNWIINYNGIWGPQPNLIDCYTWGNYFDIYTSKSSASNFFAGQAENVGTTGWQRVYTAQDTNPYPVVGLNSIYIWLNNSAPVTLTDCYIDTVGWGAKTDILADMTNAPTILTPAQAIVQNNYTNWDFDSTWATSAGVNDGYPYLRWEFPYSIDVTNPTVSQVFAISDTIEIGWTEIAIDTVKLYYSNDGGFTYVKFDSLSTVGVDTATSNWIAPSSGSYKIMVALATDTTVFGISEQFSVVSAGNIEILSPIDSSGTFTIGNNIEIIVATANISQFSLYYAINDTTLGWTLIIADIPTEIGFDTTSYIWSLPNIYGTIYLLAREVSDTVVYVYNQTPRSLGTNLRTYPQICWYDESSWPHTPIVYARYYDPTCLWSAIGRRRLTSVIDDYATGFDFTLADASYSSFLAGWPNPLLPTGTFQYTALDTSSVSITNFYSSTNIGGKVSYNGRDYYVNAADTSLYVDDLINNIDSIFVADLSNYAGGSYDQWSVVPRYLQIYNVQLSKIQGEYYPVNQDYESLNDPMFSPTILIGDDISRGQLIVAVEALAYPTSPTWVEDVARLFTSLSIQRDYFRGIDPKARKKNR